MGADSLDPSPQDGGDPRCEWSRRAAASAHRNHRHPAVLQVGHCPPILPGWVHAPGPTSPLPSESLVGDRSGLAQGRVESGVSLADCGPCYVPRLGYLISCWCLPPSVEQSRQLSKQWVRVSVETRVGQGARQPRAGSQSSSQGRRVYQGGYPSPCSPEAFGGAAWRRQCAPQPRCGTGAWLRHWALPPAGRRQAQPGPREQGRAGSVPHGGPRTAAFPLPPAE